MSPSSHFGLATSRSPRPTSTCTPTCPRRSERWRESNSPAPPLGDIAPPTIYSPSLRPCNYADKISPFTPSELRLLGEVGIILRSAYALLCRYRHNRAYGTSPGSDPALRVPSPREVPHAGSRQLQS